MDADTSDEESAIMAPLDPCWLGSAGVWAWALPGALPAATGALPHTLAVCASLALGGGAIWAALVHRIVPRLALRAPVILLGLMGMGWGAAWASGVGSPTGWLGVAALAAVGAACVPATEGGFPVGLSRAALLFLVAFVLDGAAAGWGLFAETPPWSPGLAARLLDASPRAFVMEIAGFDWMRSETVYEAVGTDRIPPMLRGPYRPAVAAAPLLVLGSVGVCLRLLLRSRRKSAQP